MDVVVPGGASTEGRDASDGRLLRAAAAGAHRRPGADRHAAAEVRRRGVVQLLAPAGVT